MRNLNLISRLFIILLSVGFLSGCAHMGMGCSGHKHHSCHHNKGKSCSKDKESCKRKHKKCCKHKKEGKMCQRHDSKSEKSGK